MRFFIGVAVALAFVVMGCSSAAQSRPRQKEQHVIAGLTGSRAAVVSMPACPMTRYQHGVLDEADQALWMYGVQLASGAGAPRDFAVQVCASIVRNGITPNGRSFAYVYLVMVKVRVVEDATGILRAESAGQQEYVSSGRQNFPCAWIEVKRGFGSDAPRCPATPEGAFFTALLQALQGLRFA